MHSIIDVHHHWMPPHHAENLRRVAQLGQTVRELRPGTMGLFRGESMLFWCNQQISSVDLLMANLDRAGISRAVISVSNWIEWLDLKMCREVNNAMHELKRRFPERILTLAHVPIGEPGALDELERSVSLGVSGVFSIVHLPRLGWSLDQEHCARLEEVSRIELGFPTDFLHRKEVRDFLHGGLFDRIRST